MATLSERLRTISAMIHLGEKISWGSETELMDEAADTLDAMERALKTFDVMMVDENGWNGSQGRERICDWFGPSDFMAVKAALAMVRK